jgi:hypothetical protein
MAMKSTRHSKEQIMAILKQGKAGLRTAGSADSTASVSRLTIAGNRSTVE